jgi:hypothetical protein
VSALYDVGETAFITIWTTDVAGQLSDADALPVATLTPIDPPGPATTPPVSHPALGAYTIAATLATAGEYVLRTVVTIAGATRVDVRRLAALPPETSTAALPAWAPSLTDVADHIPTRTRPTAAWGASDEAAGTFTADTTPNREQVTRIIRRACDWVTGQIGAPVSPAAYGVAGVAAALRAAYWIEVGYPERDADLTVYDRLAMEADAATATALRLNVATGAEDPTAGALDDLVLYEFPTPPTWVERIP